MSSPFLQVHGVKKSFDGTVALDGVALEVGPRELLEVLGPTGAGKTTLLRIIAGLTAPDAGSVRIGGEDATRLTPAERDVALVFQNFSLYPDWTVRANLEFPLQAPGRNSTKAEIDERVRWAAALLRIEHLLERDSKRLSGGEMQRVAIGRAIVRRPRIFLMDEPLTNLDAKLREALRVELVCLVRELETPLVYVTHDQAEALSMADRIVVLSEGRIQQVGEPRDIYLSPASPAVARQLGQPPMNTFQVEHKDGHWIAADGTPLAPTHGDPRPSALLGARPEHVELEGGTHAGTVEVVEDAGHARVLLVRWAGTRIHVLAPRDVALRPGDEVHPRIVAERAVVWDAPLEPLSAGEVGRSANHHAKGL